jgi:hypothetical protein
MAQYSITGPDGRLYSIDGPEGATREQVIRAIQAKMGQPQATLAPAAPPVAPAPLPTAPESPVEDQSVFRSVADVPLAFGSGLTMGVRNMVDFFGAGSEVSEALKNTEGYINSLMSAQSKQDSREMARIMQEAEGKGLGEQLRAGLKALTIAPIDVLSMSFGAMAPVVAATAATALSGGAPLLATGVGLTTAGVSGAGLIKGSIYEAVKTDPTLKEKLPPEKLEEVAQQAQAYNGENLDQILLGAGLYSAESLVGVPKQISTLTTRILAKAGAKEVAEKAVEEVAQEAGKRIIPEAIKGGAAGAGTEFLQEGQEPLAENLALQRLGVDVDTLRGVIPRATMGAGMGAVAGGAGAGVETKLARDEAAALLAPDLRTQADELADVADSLGDPQMAAYFRERAEQEREEAEPPEAPPISDAQAAEDQRAAEVVEPPQQTQSRQERPITYDLPTETPEDLELLAAQAEASGNEEEAEMYRNEADQLRIRMSERGRPATQTRITPPVQPTPSITAEEPSGQVETVQTETQEQQVEPETPQTTGVAAAPAAPAEVATTEERVGESTEQPAPGFVRLYRAEATPEQRDTGKVSDWVKESDAFKQTQEAAGRWFTDDMEEVNWYLQNEYPDGRVVYIDVPVNEAERFRVSNMPVKEKGKNVEENPRAFSRRPEKEFFLPKTLATKAAPVSAEERVTPEAVTEIKTEPTPVEITKDALLEAGVNNAALRTKGMSVALNEKAPVAERVAALREYAKNPYIESRVKANITALANSFEAKPAPKGVTAKGEPRQRKAGAGRPAQELTPEQQAEKDKTKKTTEAERSKIARRIASAAETITTPINNFINVIADRLIAETEKAEKRKLSLPERKEMALGVASKLVTEARIERLADAYRVLNKDPKARSKSAKQAKELIAHSSVTADERKAAQAAAKADPTVRAEVLSETPVDPAYKNFTTADQAISHVIATGTKFQRALASRLKPLLKGVKVVVVQNIDDVPAGEIRDNFTEGTNAAGLYSDSNRTIYINAMEGQSGTDAATVLHEGIHAATIRMIVAFMSNPKSLSLKQQRLVKQLSDIKATANERLLQRRALNTLTADELALYRAGAFSDLREFITYGLTNETMQQFLLNTDGAFIEAYAPLEMVADLLTRFVQTIRKLFGMDEEHSSAFQDLLILTDQMLSTANMKLPPVAVSVAARVNREAQQLGKQAKSERATELPGVMTRMTKAFRDPKTFTEELRNTFSTMGNKHVKALASVLSTDDLLRWVGDRLPSLVRVNKEVEAMSAWRNRQLRIISEKAEGWMKFSKSSPVAQRWLGKTMQISTLLGVDPTLHTDAATALANDTNLQDLRAEAANPNTTIGQQNALSRQINAREKDINLVYKLWSKLGEVDPSGKAKRLYSTIKNEYERTYDLQMNELLAKVRESQDIEGDADDATSPKAILLAEITSSFQEAKKIGVYFPLVRYGQYWLRVGKKGSKSSEFYMFESEFARDAMANMIAKEKGVSRNQLIETLQMDLGNDPSQLRQMIETDSSSQMLKNIYKMLDERGTAAQAGQPATGASIQDIKDTVYRMYLHTLPERDMRKRFLKRQGRTGYDTDVIRNFITTQHSAVNQLTRLKFTERLRLRLSEARDSLEGNPDKLKLGIFVDEMSKRVDLELAPPKPNDLLAQAASLGNKVVFYYMMTAPKSAAIQLLQLPTTGYAVLSAKYGSAATLAVMPKYLNIFNSLSTTRTSVDGEVITEWGQPSIQNSKYLKGIEDLELREAMTKAWNMLNDAGGFTVTYASEMSELGSRPTKETDWAKNPVSAGFRATANFMGGALHHMERLSREVMGMSSFELAYAAAKNRGLSPDAALNTAVEEALSLTTEGLFNYSQFNKPRILRSTLAKLPTQFMTFPLQMTSYLVRNFWGMLPFVNAEGKAAAAQTFFTTMAMVFVFGGVTAFPLYSAVMGMIDKYRELMRPKIEKDPQKYGTYDAADPTNPWGKRSYDLYFRDTVIPSLFGPNSSFANYFGLTEAQAQAAARAVELGPVSALTDMNIGASVALDGMWFRDETPSETNRAAFKNMAFKLLGPFGSMSDQIAAALDDFEKGDIGRGVEKLTPAFFRGVLVSQRLREEGSQTASGNQLLDAEFYTTGKLLVRTLGFASTTEAEIQKANILAKRLEQSINLERDKLIASAGDAIIEANKNPDNATTKEDMNAAIQSIMEFNARNPFSMVTGETLVESITGRIKNRERASAIQGLVVPEDLTGVFLPMIESSRVRKE